MKKNLFFSLGLSAMAALAISSCQDYDLLTEGEIRQNEYNQKYDEAFIKQFGMPDPNHDWGMNEEIGSIGAFSSSATSMPATRADGTPEKPASTVSQVLVNRNQWTEFSTKDEVTFPDYGTSAPKVKVPNYNTTALGHDIQIPGFPHLNGLYYTANGNTLDPNYKTGENITSGAIPAGDITPYEIQYVSNWFRTHPNPKSIDLHLSDFFIQNVSCDFDQVNYKTSGYDLYQAGWPNTGNNGKNISTVKEAQDHTVYGGGTYTENLVEPISYDLDYLGFQDMDGKWTHVNNFNRGNSNFSPEDNTSNPNREIKYVKSAGTENFTCRSSWSTSNNEKSKWVLVHLTWTETVKHEDSPYYKLGGTTEVPREGYYLAFDFAGEKEGQGGKKQIVNPDGYYSNWIIKITPGHFNPTGKSKRIFCEDLGGSFDFDFNDAVIDVAYEELGWPNNGKFQPIISVQAAGGTMPIYVEKKADKYELHKMLGSDKLTPINVNTSATHATAIYRGEMVSNTQTGNIHIYAHNTKTNTDYMIHGADADNYGHQRSEEDENGTHKDNDPANSNLNDINVNTVNKAQIAPRAFSAPSSVKWMKELKNIGSAYQDFMGWVQNKNSLALNSAHWYSNVTDGANLLYTPSFNVSGPTSTTGSSDDFEWVQITPATASEAVSAATAVKADSYMQLQAYNGADPIWEKLEDMTDNQRVTYTVILSSSTLYNDLEDENTELKTLKGILVPADYIAANGSEPAKMKYGTNTFTPATLNPTNSAAHVPEKKNEFGSGTYTYTLQFSFAKSDLVKSKDADGNCTYYDYLFLFLDVDDANHGTQGNTGCTVGTGTTMGTNSGVTIQRWYVHY